MKSYNSEDVFDCFEQERRMLEREDDRWYDAHRAFRAGTGPDPDGTLKQRQDFWKQKPKYELIEKEKQCKRLTR